jgi:aspartate racemase
MPRGPSNADLQGYAAGSGRLLGVLGGMGPLATVDFLGKIVELTPARIDQEHLPVITLSDPAVPDRSDAIVYGQEAEVLDRLTSRLNLLIAAGAKAIAIPCNSAHHWYDALQARSPVPILHIADAAVRDLAATTSPGARVAVLGTEATAKADFYHLRLMEAGYSLVGLPPDVQRQTVSAAITRVKAGNLDAAAERLREAAEYLEEQDVEAALLACTELPLAVRFESGSCRLLDCTTSLAKACIEWWRTGETAAQ